VADQVVATRYAEALLGAIDDGQRLDGICDELRAISGLVADNAQMKAFLEGPNIVESHKHAFVQKIFAEKIERETLDFLRLLLHKHRIAHLAEIADEFARMVEARRNQVRVQVTTAFALPPDMHERLKRALDAVTDKDCLIQTRTDPRVIGGVVAVVEDRVLDGSLRSSLGELRKQLMAAPLQ
jgi:F-type H+-transporting ATPase subunit delta